MKQSSDLNRVKETGEFPKNEASLKRPIMGKKNFLRNICFASWVVASIVLFTGCNSNTSIVKKSILIDIDHSLSIGDALDKYKYFTRTEWREFKTEQGRNVVEFKGHCHKWNGIVMIQFILNTDLIEDSDGLNFRVGYKEVSIDGFSGKRCVAQASDNLIYKIYRNKVMGYGDDDTWGEGWTRRLDNAHSDTEHPEYDGDDQ
jgi:hypothetical protein